MKLTAACNSLQMQPRRNVSHVSLVNARPSMMHLLCWLGWRACAAFIVSVCNALLIFTRNGNAKQHICIVR